MSYYMGDYYRGGFFGSLFGGIKKIGGLLLGGGGGGGTKIITMPGGAAPMATAVSHAISKVRAGGAIAGKLLSKHPVLSAAGAAGAIAGGAAMMHHAGRVSAAAGGGGGGHRRRMNVCNPRALRRAIRRTHGFAKLAMKTIHITHPKKKGRFGGFKKRKSK